MVRVCGYENVLLKRHDMKPIIYAPSSNMVLPIIEPDNDKIILTSDPAVSRVWVWCRSKEGS